jgi:hypothetical protein
VKHRKLAFGLVLAAVACGARTALIVPDHEDASVDASPDVRDASRDRVIDAPEEDVEFPDVPIISDCPDAGDTLIYLLGDQNELYSFYPPTLKFRAIGTIGCEMASTPNSMAVTRSGIAFTNFHDGNMFEVSTLNAACKATPYLPNQHGWTTYGMGYANGPDGGEILYVSGSSPPAGLATVDTTTFKLGFIANFQPPEQDICELTGTGAGELFGYCPQGNNSHLIQIDPATAKVLSSHPFSFSIGNAYAFAFWGGDFWIFHGSGQSTVTKYDPVTQMESTATTAPILVVGAGVSTCAPQK